MNKELLGGPLLLGRYLDKIQPDPAGCWGWTGALNSQRYGSFRVGSCTARAHRISYELFVGPIPDELVVDHLCRNPWCVRPSHLEVVTGRENTQRGRSGWNSSAKTQCPRGHEYTHRDARGARVCQICRREQQRERRARSGR